LGALKSDATARRLAYMVFWRNEAYNPGTFYLPYPGSVLEADFLRFYHEPLTLFGGNLPRMYE
jgi:mannan endo-1,4-beta-mannosidase